MGACLSVAKGSRGTSRPSSDHKIIRLARHFSAKNGTNFRSVLSRAEALITVTLSYF
eukprot:SAG11_NODE_2361_length_3462_cov_2.031519_4_plen_57_part_00